MSGMPNRTPRRRGGGFVGSTTNDYRSSCPVCRQGIWAGDQTVWIKRPVTGTVHAGCAPKEET